MKSKLDPSQENLMIWELTPDFVKKQQFEGFLKNWAPDKLPRGAALRPLLNTFVFRFKGFSENPHQLLMLPETRAFCRAFFETWPFWFFFCDLRTPDLLLMVLCRLEKLQVLEDESNQLCKLSFNAEELDEFVQRALCAMSCLCKRADMSESEITALSWQGLNYLQTSCNPSGKTTGGRSGIDRWN